MYESTSRYIEDTFSYGNWLPSQLTKRKDSSVIIPVQDSFENREFPWETQAQDNST